MDFKKPKNFTCTIVSISCMQFYLEREIKQHAFFFWDNRGRKDIIVSFSSDVFERRTSTGSEPFSILKCLDAIKFVLLRVFTLIEAICANICLKSRLKSAKVYVRLMSVTQRRSLNSLITGWTDGRTDGEINTKLF